MGRPWQGLLLVDKPSGPTSHDVVDAVRRLTGQRRVGHAGTLDPLASGLLPLALGRATRLLRFLPGSPKAYEGSLRLGLSSDTDDVTGEVLERHTAALPSAAEVLGAGFALEGRHAQRPPAYSARKVAGRRLYELARRGLAVEAPAREVEVSAFRLTPGEDPALYSFRTEVSAGTYVRALVRDLGAALGCGAVLASLRRTRIGPMALERATALPGDEAPEAARLRLGAALLPPERMPLEPPPLRLTDGEACRRFVSGAAVRPPEDGDLPQGAVSVRDAGGALLGVGEWSGGWLRPSVVVAETPPPKAPERR